MISTDKVPAAERSVFWREVSTKVWTHYDALLRLPCSSPKSPKSPKSPQSPQSPQSPPRDLQDLSASETSQLSALALALDVLTLSLADALDTEPPVPPRTGQQALTAKIHAFIQDHLGDARLAPAMIAAAHHISLRYLHRLFHEEGRTVVGWIRRQRLERCRRDLADPLLAGVPIGAVAARWGFASHTHFSRAFRGAYGLTPSAYRERRSGS
ncbi:helix-turn-helix domain-containing protein [Nonomuraea sp. PA05]|uniref:helix-turn-helix domain-containing protein n=1 Tax=Nonomuraea sp. PA05 TaxID=2604466 RepID=UPI001CA378FD|nr:helix-turn-helix domain-containing protein [Nonomuraea sp. PA05]